MELGENTFHLEKLVEVEQKRTLAGSVRERPGLKKGQVLHHGIG